MLQNQNEIESPTVMEIAIKFSIFFTEKALLNKNTWHVRQLSLFPLLFEYEYPKLKTQSHCALNINAYQQDWNTKRIYW